MKTDQPTNTVVSGSGRHWQPIGTAYMDRNGSLRMFFDKPDAAILSFRVEPIRPTFWQRLRAAVAASEILSFRFGASMRHHQPR